MKADTDVGRLQEALDLVADMEKRRTVILESMGHFVDVLGEPREFIERTLDATYTAVYKHLFECMMLFVPPKTDAD